MTILGCAKTQHAASHEQLEADNRDGKKNCSMLTWHAKAGNSLATLAGAGPDVHHARLLALGTVRGLLLTSVCKVGLGPPAEALAGGGPHIDHIVGLAPVFRSSKGGVSTATFG